MNLTRIFPVTQPPMMNAATKWRLKRIEKLQGDILKADCVFEGKTEFPKPFHEHYERWLESQKDRQPAEV
ncbi:MAG: hypothetical protein ACBR50_02215 [Microcoleus sp.]